MDYSESLLTFAELAIALAGFASVVSVFADHANEALRTRANGLLRIMLEISFRNAAFALGPLPFLQWAGEGQNLWRVWSGAFMVAAVAHAVSLVRRGGGGGDQERWLRWTVFGLLVLNVAACLANVAGLGGPYAFSLYLASLSFGLCVAGLSYLTVAGAAFRTEQDV